MTLLNGLHQEVEQSPFVFPVLGVGELWQVRDVKLNSSSRGGHYIRFAVLHQFREMKLES